MTWKPQESLEDSIVTGADRLRESLGIPKDMVLAPAERALPATPENALELVLRSVVPMRLARGHAVGGEWVADIIVGLHRLGYDVTPLTSERGDSVADSVAAPAALDVHEGW